jgi:WD40 repeat protein
VVVHKIPLDGSAPAVLEDVLRSGLYLGPNGRYLATRFRDTVHVRDLETGERLELEVPGEGNVTTIPFDSAGRLLMARGDVVSRWDPETRSIEVLVGEGAWAAGPLCDDRRIFIRSGDPNDAVTRWVVDLEEGTRTPVAQPHQQATHAGWDPQCSILASGHADGEVRVGPFFDEEHHLLLGHEIGETRANVSPDGRWVVSRGSEGRVRLWPMPDLSRRPFHTLPYDELMARLKALTNLRAVPDEESHTGYTIEPDFAAYRGWETVPEW